MGFPFPPAPPPHIREYNTAQQQTMKVPPRVSTSTRTTKPGVFYVAFGPPSHIDVGLFPHTTHSHKNACAAFTNLRGVVFVFARIDWINSRHRMLFFNFFFTSFRGNALRQCLKCVLPQRAYN